MVRTTIGGKVRDSHYIYLPLSSVRTYHCLLGKIAQPFYCLPLWYTIFFSSNNFIARSTVTMTFADGTYIDCGDDYLAIFSLAPFQFTMLQLSLVFPTEHHMHRPQFYILSNVTTVSLVRTLPTLRPSFHSTRNFDYVAKSEHHDCKSYILSDPRHDEQHDRY